MHFRRPALPAGTDHLRRPPPCHPPAELTEKLPEELEGLAASFEKLEVSLGKAKEYVDAVVVSCCACCCCQLLRQGRAPPASLRRGCWAALAAWRGACACACLLACADGPLNASYLCASGSLASGKAAW